MSSARFRAGLLGRRDVGGSALFKYMASGDKSRRQQMAFGAFFGDGTEAGLTSRTMSTSSLQSGPDSLDEDIEAGKKDLDYDSADSLDDDLLDEEPKDGADGKSLVSKDSLDDDDSLDGDDDSDDDTEEDEDDDKDDDEDKDDEEDEDGGDDDDNSDD